MNTNAPAAYADYGFFGPDSVVWKVFRFPSSFTVGFQRTVISEMFEPFLLASVSATDAILSRPAVRYDRTMQYVSTVAYADSPTAVKAADILFRIHSHIRGIEPISGGAYDANAPDAQLWIHLTQWHSVLLCYEIFGPGKLSEAEENQYWAECRRAVALQTIDPETVPRNRAEMRAYYERIKPRLAATVETQRIVEHLLDAHESLFSNAPAALKPLLAPVQAAMRAATIATLPQWMRKMGGIQQSKAADRAAITAMRIGLNAIAALPIKQQLKIVQFLSPATEKVIAPALLGQKPIRESVVSMDEAWTAAGRPMPRVQYQDGLSKRGETPQRAPRDRGADALLQFA